MCLPRHQSTMPTKKTAAKKTSKKKAAKPTKSFEESLWDSANKLRGSIESSEYKHVVLSLIFLKFVSDKFEERRQQLIAADQEEFVEMVEFYTMENVFYLPETSRWNYIQEQAKQGDIALKIDTALKDVEKNNVTLKGALPDNYFSRIQLDPAKLSALLDTISNIDTVADKEEDTVGRVYEYFLGKFAASEGKLGGEFYTPKCIVNLIAEMIEPYKGKIYDPCCGSGGMFVQSLKFVQNHEGSSKDISVYGQEYTATTYKLAKMNLAVRGITGDLGAIPADTFFKDQHKDLKADFIMANPPFNLKDWRGANELTSDPRWSGYETPPTGNANYGWILHMISKLSENGTAGFVMANGSMSTASGGEDKIRQKMVENDLIDCMIALPGQLFFTTQIPVCIWILSKNKKARTIEIEDEDGKGQAYYRDRSGETLFIDARKIGNMISRTQKELTDDDIQKITKTYHGWKMDYGEINDENGTIALVDPDPSYIYQDEPGYSKSVKLEEIKKHDHVLTPGRYVGAAPLEDDGIPFEVKMKELSQTLYAQMDEAKALDQTITENLNSLGYGR